MLLIVINFLQWLTGILQGFSFDFSFDGSVINTIIGIIDFVAWVLPLGTVFTIITITFALMGFRILVSVLRTIMDILPVV